MNGFTVVVSIVKVPVSFEGCSTFGAVPLAGSFDAPGWPVSRILSSRRVSRGTPPAWRTISLGRPLPDGSCSLPETRGRRAASHPPRGVLSLLGLAPGRGYLAAALLRRRWSLKPPFHPYRMKAVRHCESEPAPALPAFNSLIRRYISVARSSRFSSCEGVPRSGCYPAPCSVECGLSSTPA
jgi:hypothetical protein